MIAVDTNVPVRFLVEGDPQQAKKARARLEAGPIFLATTVILGTEWVLRGAYGLDRIRIPSALTALAGLPNIVLEEPVKVSRALDGVSQGLDFADALHLYAAEACEAFLTFDKRLVTAAGQSPIPILDP